MHLYRQKTCCCCFCVEAVAERPGLPADAARKVDAACAVRQRFPKGVTAIPGVDGHSRGILPAPSRIRQVKWKQQEALTRWLASRSAVGNGPLDLQLKCKRELSLCEEILLKKHELEEVRSAERGGRHTHAHQGRSRMSWHTLGQTRTRVLVGQEEDARRFRQSRAALESAGQSCLAASRRENCELTAQLGLRSASHGPRPDGTSSLVAGDERTRVVKDRARRPLFAVTNTAVPRTTSELAGRSKPFRMLGLLALFHHSGRQTEFRLPESFGLVAFGLGSCGWRGSKCLGGYGPSATPSSRATWRETRDKIHPRHGPVSNSEVTLRLGPIALKA